jgi:hypothetical protein
MREELAHNLLVLEQRSFGNLLVFFVLNPSFQPRARALEVKRSAGRLLVNLRDDLAALRFDQPPGAPRLARPFPLRRDLLRRLAVGRFS